MALCCLCSDRDEPVDQLREAGWHGPDEVYEVLVRVLERVVAESGARFDGYELRPERLRSIQQSQAYAFRFIIDVAAVVICGAVAIRSGIHRAGRRLLPCELSADGRMDRRLVGIFGE